MLVSSEEQARQAHTENLLAHIENGLSQLDQGSLEGGGNLFADLLGDLCGNFLADLLPDLLADSSSSPGLKGSLLLAHGVGYSDSDLITDFGEIEVDRGSHDGLPSRNR
jgi:hypothetical protein